MNLEWKNMIMWWYLVSKSRVDMIMWNIRWLLMMTCSCTQSSLNMLLPFQAFAFRSQASVHTSFACLGFSWVRKTQIVQHLCSSQWAGVPAIFSSESDTFEHKKGTSWIPSDLTSWVFHQDDVHGSSPNSIKQVKCKKASNSFNVRISRWFFQSKEIWKENLKRAAQKETKWTSEYFRQFWVL